jgi:hypothetical protein
MSLSEAQEKGITKWPVWEKEVSEFDWHYDNEEHFYLVEGEVIVSCQNEKYHLNPGDYVVMRKGIDTHWKVIKPVYKHYIMY